MNPYLETYLGSAAFGLVVVIAVIVLLVAVDTIAGVRFRKRKTKVDWEESKRIADALNAQARARQPHINERIRATFNDQKPYDPEQLLNTPWTGRAGGTAYPCDCRVFESCFECAPEAAKDFAKAEWLNAHPASESLPEVDGVLYARFPAPKLVETVTFGRCPKCGCFAKDPENCGRCSRKAGGKTLMEVLCPGKPDELV